MAGGRRLQGTPWPGGGQAFVRLVLVLFCDVACCLVLACCCWGGGVLRKGGREGGETDEVIIALIDNESSNGQVGIGDASQPALWQHCSFALLTIRLAW